MSRSLKKPTYVHKAGYHNDRFEKNPTEIVKGHSYNVRSTVCFVPSPTGEVPVRWVQSYNQTMKGMNQMFHLQFLVNDEVGKAYEQMVDILRANPDLQKWKYVLTWEWDNLPPPDGIIKLWEDIEASNFDAVGGLYWTKGEGGQPMCYGRADVFPRDFVPWLPPDNSVAQCHGLGMGFTLFKMKMFLDERWERPIFKTEQSYEPGKGIRQYTQDLRMFENAAKLGYKVGCSTRVKVGHYSKSDDMVW